VYSCEIVFLLDILPSDSKSISSLGSCDSGQLLKSLEISQQAATDAIRCSGSSADTDNVSRACDWRVPEPTSDISALVSNDLFSSSPKSTEGLFQNDSDLASDTTKMESSCRTTTDVLQIDVPQTMSIFNNAKSMSDRNDGSQNTVETTASVYDHALSDCNTNQLLEDYVKAVVPLQNFVPNESFTILEGYAAIGLQNSSSLNMNKLSDAVEDRSDAVNMELCVSIDSAFKSRCVKPTIMSPSEDFQSIYSSCSKSQTSSPTTCKAFQSMPPESTHSYHDSDNMDAWLEFLLPEKSTAQSLCVSRRTVWYVDITERLYYSSLKGPGLSWNTDSQPAEQISCSPSGFIIWRVYRGSAFSAIGRITGKYPAGTEWREVAREVAYVAADDSVVW